MPYYSKCSAGQHPTLRMSLLMTFTLTFRIPPINYFATVTKDPVVLRSANAVAETLPAIYWQKVSSEYARPRRSAQRVQVRQTAGLDAVDTVGLGPDRSLPPPERQSRRWLLLAQRGCRALRGRWRCYRRWLHHAGATEAASAHCLHTPVVAGSVGAPKKPLLFTGAPVESSLCSVSLLIGRISPAG